MQRRPRMPGMGKVMPAEANRRPSLTRCSASWNCPSVQTRPAAGHTRWSGVGCCNSGAGHTRWSGVDCCNSGVVTRASWKRPGIGNRREQPDVLIQPFSLFPCFSRLTRHRLSSQQPMSKSDHECFCPEHPKASESINGSTDCFSRTHDYLKYSDSGASGPSSGSMSGSHLRIARRYASRRLTLST